MSRPGIFDGDRQGTQPPPTAAPAVAPTAAPAVAPTAPPYGSTSTIPRYRDH